MHPNVCRSASMTASKLDFSDSVCYTISPSRTCAQLTSAASQKPDFCRVLTKVVTVSCLSWPWRCSHAYLEKVIGWRIFVNPAHDRGMQVEEAYKSSTMWTLFSQHFPITICRNHVERGLGTWTRRCCDISCSVSGLSWHFDSPV